MFEITVEALAVVVRDCENLGGEPLKHIRSFLDTLSPGTREKVAQHVQVLRDSEKLTGPARDVCEP